MSDTDNLNIFLLVVLLVVAITPALASTVRHWIWRRQFDAAWKNRSESDE